MNWETILVTGQIVAIAAITSAACLYPMIESWFKKDK
jgi:hypothetical protein